MPKRILVSVDPYEARAALLDGDSLANVEIESAASNKRKGNVYRGKVTAVEPGIDAAFVDYGAAKDGFLPFDEVSSKSLNQLTGHGRAGSRSGLKTGDWILVQVTKEEVGKKGATLTMHVSLPGRFVVLMPFSDRTGISRKLGGEERARLRSLAQQLKIPEGYGCIVRTVGEDERLEDLQADLDQQTAAWEAMVANYQSRKGAGEVHVEAGLALRFVRDYMTSDVGEVLVEDETSYRELATFLEARMPQRRQQLKRYSGDVPLFLRHGVERQIEALLNNKVALPSGGSIVIGQTEALVAIDVNSGRTKQKDIEDTAFRTNLEAAREIARQVVLRDLGGIIVVDFIDMESEAHNRAVEEEMKASFRWDKARLTFTRIQEFGLLSFSRQRLRQAVDSGITLQCPTCAGSGRVRSPNLLAMSALRKIRERLATQGARAAFVEVTVPVEVGNFLNNRKREALTSLERKFDVLIDVVGDPDALPDDLKLTVLGEVPQGRKSILGYEESEEPEGGEAAAGDGDGDEAEDRGTPRVAAASEDRSSPGKGRSLFRGLISKFLGLEELAEVPPPAPARTAPRAERIPAPPPAPMPAPRPAAPSRAAAIPPAPATPAAPKAAPAAPAAPKAAPAIEPRPYASDPRRGSSDARRPAAPTHDARRTTDDVLPADAPPTDGRRPTADEADASLAGGESPARKRRRRRRRHGKGGAGEGGEALPMEAGSAADEAAFESGPEAEAPAADETPGTEGEAAPKRRRRRRRSKGGAGEAGAPTGEAGAPTGEAGAPTGEAGAPTGEPSVPFVADFVLPAVPVRTAPVPVTVAPVPLPPAPAAEDPAEPAKRPRGGRGRKKADAAAAPAADAPDAPSPAHDGGRTAQDAPAADAPAADAPAAEAAPGEEPRKRPRHRGGRGRKKADGAEVPADAASDAPPPAGDGPHED